MTLTYLKKIKIRSIACALLVFFVFPQAIVAQGISLSVTPILFEMSAVPLQAWTSSIKVINNNQQELTVYANVVNFAPQGETGQGKFIPVLEGGTEGKTLAEWISVPSKAYVIPQESSVEIPVVVNVPEDAAPGGHFAAITIGTRPPNGQNKLQVATSQMVTSLFFVRIAGDVIENGSVRTFKALNSFVDTPEVDFEVRFENKGNVHLQPQGQIVITNMWGKERGIVPINYQTNFGNVLPNSIRQFDFTWKGESSFTDIGRYTADLTLAYGVDSRKFTTQSTFFWVIPVKAVLMVLGGLGLIVLLVVLSIRSYVRRVLSLSGVQGYVPRSQRTVHQGDLVMKKVSVIAPLSGGVSDLKERLVKTHAFLDTSKTLCVFIYNYKKFFISSVLLLLAFVISWYFISDVTTDQRDYEVTIDNKDTSVTLSSEEIIYKQSQNKQTAAVTTTDITPETDDQKFELVLINSSDTPGVAATMQEKLEQKGYEILSLKSDFGESRDTTVIIYDTQILEEALRLSKELGGVVLSARPDSNNVSTPNISVRIGNNFESE